MHLAHPCTCLTAPLDHREEHGPVAGDVPTGTLSWWGRFGGPGTAAEADIRCTGVGRGVRTRSGVLLRSPSSQRRSLGDDKGVQAPGLVGADGVEGGCEEGGPRGWTALLDELIARETLSCE